MNRLHYLFITLLVCSLFSCKQPGPEHDLVGHWISRSFIDSLEKYNNDPSKVSHVSLVELVFDRPDSNLKRITIGAAIKGFKYEPVTKNTIRIKRFTNLEEIDLVLSKDKQTLSYTDPVKNQTHTFIRVNPEEVGDTLASPIPSYGIAFLNNRFVAGDYVWNDTVPVTLQSNGYIAGLPNHTSYSICINKNCQKFSNNPLIFLSNARNEGFYYEWEVNADTLNIYNLDAARWPDKSGNFKRSDLLYRLVRK